MTTILTFQTFCNSIRKSWYLSFFSCHQDYVLVARNSNVNNLTLYTNYNTNYVWSSVLYNNNNNNNNNNNDNNNNNIKG